MEAAQEMKFGTKVAYGDKDDAWTLNTRIVQRMRVIPYLTMKNNCYVITHIKRCHVTANKCVLALRTLVMLVTLLIIVVNVIVCMHVCRIWRHHWQRTYHSKLPSCHHQWTPSLRVTWLLLWRSVSSLCLAFMLLITPCCSPALCGLQFSRLQTNSPSLLLENVWVMVIIWRLRGKIIRIALCWIVWHNVHSPQHTYVSSSYRSNRLGLSHWDPYAVRRDRCLELYYSNMSEWFWWDSSLISTTNVSSGTLSLHTTTTTLN